MSDQPLTVLSEEEGMFRDAVRSFAKEQIAPYAGEMDKAMKIRPEILDGCFELGLMGIEIPERFGGSDSTFFNSILAIEALAEADASVSVMVDVQNTLVINALLNWGNEAQQERYLTRLAKDWVGAYALSEPSSGSDAFALKTRAEDKGDHFVLNGTKLWITNGMEASVFVLMATVDPSLGYRGITSFLVEKDFEGFGIGAKEDKLGIRASSTTELILEDCIVPKENVLGEVGKGYKVAIETLNEGRIGIGAQMIGVAQGAFDHAMAYLRERKQFNTRLCDFQGVQFQFADLATQIEAARLLVYNAARLRQANRPFLKEAAMAKLFSSIMAERVTSQCVEFLGGVGYSKEFPVEKYYRDAKIGQIYEGTSNLQRLTIAKQLLKHYGD
ncbi:MAG: acyl-CoA dehydrogenase [Myxococcales bacterium]|nr:acyl-CoA dehydrogenase [Myxococcales bacterium]